MRLTAAVLAAAVLTAGLSFAATGDGTAGAATQAHALPADVHAVIITYDYTGGMLRRATKDPVLTIHADGTTRAGDPYGAGKGVDGKLSPDELQSLLHDLLDVKQLATLDSKDLAPPMGQMVTDAMTTRVTVALPEANKEVSAYGLMADVQAGPDAPKNRFFAIRARLDGVVNATLLGSADGVAKALDAVNAELKKTLPEEKPLTVADLDQVSIRPGGTMVANFSKKTPISTGSHMLWATLTRTADGKSTVEVKAKDLEAK